MNDTEILVCAKDNNFNTTNHGAIIQELLIYFESHDVEMKTRKLSGLGQVRLGQVKLGYVRLGFRVSISMKITQVKEVNKVFENIVR